MKIERKIETANASYNIYELNDKQFKFLLAALNHYAHYTHHCTPDPESDIGQLIDKLEKMEQSSITVIK